MTLKEIVEAYKALKKNLEAKNAIVEKTSEAYKYFNTEFKYSSNYVKDSEGNFLIHR